MQSFIQPSLERDSVRVIANMRTISLRLIIFAAAFFQFVVPGIAVATTDGVAAYRIDTQKGKHSFLIGSMHVPYPGLRQPSPQVLDSAKTLVIEHTTADEKPDVTLAPEVLAAFAEGRDVRADWAGFITAAHLAAIRGRLACGTTTAVDIGTLELFLRLRSARIMSMLATVPCDAMRGPSRDAILETAAAARHLSIKTLETQAEVEERRRAVGNEVYVGALKTGLNTDLDAAYGRIVNAFNDGDFDAISAMAAASFGSEENGRVVQHLLVRDRNRAWMPALRTALDAGNAVIVVGAAHLPGSDGLVAMLRRAGYRVTSTMLAAGPEGLTKPLPYSTSK
ncbi:TraB/GumN family protein [Massilia sp.]|uniref:TraB/GumN family protein n=1 Tax=Massilia sp. TaxID=1882437 RepID=UPI00352F09B7